MLKIFSILVSALIAVFVFKSAYQQVEYNQYMNKLILHLSELEKIPQTQKTSSVLLEIADLYLQLDYDKDKIINAYIDASRLGSHRADYVLAVLKRSGLYKSKMDMTAEDLFIRASKNGNLNASFLLKAQSILDGSIKLRGFSDAVIKLKTASSEGNFEATFALCQYGKEEASPVFVANNVEYCQKILKQDYPPAQYLMGRLYEQNSIEFPTEIWENIGFYKDVTKAKEFYRQAANQSYNPAIERIKVLNKRGSIFIIKSKDRYAYDDDAFLDYFK